MKYLCILTIILGLCLPTFAMGAESAVIDRSTRVKSLNDYALLTRDHIQSRWTSPVDYDSTSALKGKIAINYTIRKDGSLEKIHLVHGSGNTEMDKSFIKALKTATPFPPFPEQITSGSITIKANFIIADLPTVPVLTAKHETAKRNVNLSEPDNKKYLWGLPAGSSSRNGDIQNPASERPEPKKFKWGKE